MSGRRVGQLRAWRGRVRHSWRLDVRCSHAGRRHRGTSGGMRSRGVHWGVASHLRLLRFGMLQASNLFGLHLLPCQVLLMLVEAAVLRRRHLVTRLVVVLASGRLLRGAGVDRLHGARRARMGRRAAQRLCAELLSTHRIGCAVGHHRVVGDVVLNGRGGWRIERLANDAVQRVAVLVENLVRYTVRVLGHDRYHGQRV